MTAQAFNPATCSEQDWGARMAHVDACLAQCAFDPEVRALYAQHFAEHLHRAMGWRADHADLAEGLYV